MLRLKWCYLAGANVNVAQLHQLADHLHATGAIRGRQRGQHHCCIAGVVLEVHITHTCKAKKKLNVFQSLQANSSYVQYLWQSNSNTRVQQQADNAVVAVRHAVMQHCVAVVVGQIDQEGQQ